jgi:hypothetical protein
MEKFSVFQLLREKYPIFQFKFYQYHWENQKKLIIQFTYSIGDEWTFSPTMEILFGENVEVQKIDIDSFIYHLGIVELISYWKATCSPDVQLPHPIHVDEIPFWKTVFYHGLGEFFYKNGIFVSEDEFMNITASNFDEVHPMAYPYEENKVLVPIGGGKDSSVTLHILQKNNYHVVPFIINPSKTTLNIIHAAGISEKNAIFVHRPIDPVLLSMNEKGFLNGHIPFSAVIAFYTSLVAALAGIKHIALSNESSANESTIPGTKINHQYSKTFEFEKLFRHFTHRFLSPTTNYFSFLRPINELQIGALFAKMPMFHSVFRSCNVGSKQGIWCNHCPKCLFTHIILSPFLDPDYIQNIIGLKTFDNPSLEEEMLQLMGESPKKPFECVGTINEVRSALAYTLHEKYQLHRAPLLLTRVANRLTQEDFVLFRSLLSYFDEHHFLPPLFEQILRYELEKL